AADGDLVESLPGIAGEIATLRRSAAGRRPALETFAPERRPLERLARSVLATPAHEMLSGSVRCERPLDSLREAERLHARLAIDPRALRALGEAPLLRDVWTGDLRPAGGDASLASYVDAPGIAADPDARPARG